eukprot:6511860-Alexandrium_andersonii.AAC.1
MCISGFGTCANTCEERTPRELRGPVLRPFLGPRSSSSERLKHSCAFGRADCRLGRLAALAGLERVADCT